MSPLVSIAGGLFAAAGILGVAASTPTSLTALTSKLTSTVLTADQIDRAVKGDRLAINRVSAEAEQPKVTTVEVVGLRDTAVVYRDRNGRVLFRTDPVENVTIVAKDVSLPEVTVREHSSAVPQQMPVKTLREDKSERMVGCDPLVSPLAGSSLSQVAGRCIAGLATGQKFAALAQ